MKYIFDVTSNLTFHVADRIIELDSIPKDDCYLFLIRNYNIPPFYADIYTHLIKTSYNVDGERGRVFKGWKVWQTVKNIKDFDRLIFDNIGDNNFIWYTPVCSNDLCSLMVSKKNCKGYYVIEDGIASYRNFNPQTFTRFRFLVYKLILKPFFSRIFCVKNHFISTDHEKFLGCIATTKLCFPLHQNYLRVIGYPFPKNTFTPCPDAVISIDPWYGVINENAIRTLYTKLGKYIRKKNYKKVACKFHPAFDAPQNTAIKNTYLAILSQNFDSIEILPADTLLESLLCDKKQDFYCGMSSVVLYVSQNGVNCYSFMPLVKNTAVYIELPPFFKKLVTEITETDIPKM